MCELGPAEPVIVEATAASVDFEPGRSRLHEHRHERATRVVVRGEVKSKLDGARLEDPLRLSECAHDDLFVEPGAQIDWDVQCQRHRREPREE